MKLLPTEIFKRYELGLIGTLLDWRSDCSCVRLGQGLRAIAAHMGHLLTCDPASPVPSLFLQFCNPLRCHVLEI